MESILLYYVSHVTALGYGCVFELAMFLADLRLVQDRSSGQDWTPSKKWGRQF